MRLVEVIKQQILVGILSVALSYTICHANSYTFVTESGATDAGGAPVSAEVSFSTVSGSIFVNTLANLTSAADFKDAGQVLSGVFFSIDGISTPDVTLSSQVGSSRTVASDGSFTDNGFVLDPNWGISNVSGGPFPDGTTGLHLDGLGKTGMPSECKDSACFTIIPNLGTYSGANNSITGNSGHNPFLTNFVALPGGSGLSLSLNVTGVTDSSVIDDVFFSFGTAGSDNVPGVLVGVTGVPEPGYSGLLGLGVIAIGWLARRNSRRSENAG